MVCVNEMQMCDSKMLCMIQFEVYWQRSVSRLKEITWLRPSGCIQKAAADHDECMRLWPVLCEISDRLCWKSGHPS